MAFDQHKNLAVASIATAPTPADVGTVLSVAAGQAAYFQAPPFNATVWPKDALPLPTNAEIVRVVAIDGDQFTILRQQEDTLARAIVVGDMIAVTVTAATVIALESGLHFPQIDTPLGSFDAVDIRETAAPVAPPVNTARLYAIDVNGYPLVEVMDSDGNAVRLAADSIVVVKVTTAIARGQAVYLAGASGANALVGLAQSDVITTLPCIGLALDPGAPNNNIRVLLTGTMQQINTSAFNEGDRLFVSDTTPGGLTATPPPAPAFTQRVAIVTRKHASQGEVLVLTTAVASADVALPDSPTFEHLTVTNDPLLINGSEVYVQGTATLDDWFDQDVKEGASPIFKDLKVATLVVDDTNQVDIGGATLTLTDNVTLPDDLPDMPTAPLGQVLISQGAFVPPVFSGQAVLSHPTVPSLLFDNPGAGASFRKMRIKFEGDNLQIGPETPAGSMASALNISMYNGNLTTAGAVVSYSGGLGTYSHITPFETTVATLNSYGGRQPGALANISDSTTETTGAIITGGGTFRVFARWDGTNWRVVSGKMPTAVIGQVLLSQGVDVPPVYTSDLKLAGAGTKFSMRPGTREFIIEPNDAGGAIFFGRSDVTTKFAVSFTPDSVSFGTSGGNPGVGTMALSSNQQPIVLTTAGGGGSFPILLGKRAMDGHPAVGCSVEVWPATGTVDPALAVMAPGGATRRWGVDKSGVMFLTEMAFAALPAGQPLGSLANVSDSTTDVPGSVVAGGGTKHVLARWEGTAWRVTAGVTAVVSTDVTNRFTKPQTIAPTAADAGLLTIENLSPEGAILALKDSTAPANKQLAYLRCRGGGVQLEMMNDVGGGGSAGGAFGIYNGLFLFNEGVNASTRLTLGKTANAPSIRAAASLPNCVEIRRADDTSGAAICPTEMAFSALPVTPPIGTLANISDCTSETPGAIADAGGTFHVLARWNGTNWKVIG